MALYLVVYGVERFYGQYTAKTLRDSLVPHVASYEQILVCEINDWALHKGVIDLNTIRALEQPEDR